MATKSETLIELAGLDFSSLSEGDMKDIYRSILQKGMHGLCFSPYKPGQQPGDIITVDQIKERLAVVSPYTNWIRTFSCTGGNENIPALAHEAGLKTLVGAWLGIDLKKNEEEIESLIKIASNSHADMVAVGNEVMYRKDLTEDELLGYMEIVKEALPGIPVGYSDAYYEFSNRPRITEACDVLLASCHPFWEGCHIDYALLYMKDMYYRAVIAGNGKNVIITETGWPNAGHAFGSSVPSVENALKYFINTNLWAMEEKIDMFYFSSFDEAWKANNEGDGGGYWGIWDTHGNLKLK